MYMIYGLKSLPSRILKEKDEIGNIKEFSIKQNRYLKGLKMSLYFKNFPIWSAKWIFRIITISLYISEISISIWFPYSLIISLISGIFIKIIYLID